MKISLQHPHTFWGLMNPKNLKCTLTLTDHAPISGEINQEKLEQWEVKQIITSVKAKRISISVQIEDLVKLIPTEDNKVEKKAPAPKAKKAASVQ